MEHLVFFAFVGLAAAFFALLEVQIEGGNGWATALPTWVIDAPWARRLMGGRPLTGYHTYCQLFLLTAAHAPFGLGLAPWSIRAEARVLAFIVLFWIVEDFLWFVLNPRFGLRGFTPERATWHAHAWWGFMPREYWLFLPIAVGLYAWSI